jgi:hypothetical protein
MQMTNYRAYLKGSLSGKSPSKQDLRLRAATRSGDPKKIVKAINQLLGLEGATTRILHLKDEEIFGSTKWKLDLPPCDDGSKGFGSLVGKIGLPSLSSFQSQIPPSSFGNHSRFVQ